MTKRIVLGFVALSLIVAAPASVLADVSDIIFRVTATNEAGTGSFEATFDQMIYYPVQQAWVWGTGAVPIEDEFGTPIALLQNANVLLQADPKIAVGFSVQSGASLTTFTIESAVLSFPTISDAVSEGMASVSMNVSDAWGGDGVTLAELGAPGSGIYQTFYNTDQLFVNLISMVSAGPGGSGNMFQNYPPVGYTDVAGDVSSMHSWFGFTLTPGDIGGATSLYEIVPEPATFGLLVVLALVAVRRR